MIKFKIVRNTGFIGLILISIFSCNQKDFLETRDKSNLTDATMWATEDNADIFLNSCYADLVQKGNQSDNLDNFTADNDQEFYYTSFNWHKGICIASSNDYSIWGQQTGPANDANWPETYTKIRKINTFIQ